ncbi:hypothetical protein B566_EDAN002086 [Ephemera danica]|nr:hypothetical protein B566_EDAN002086 [Ephemera danica]
MRVAPSSDSPRKPIKSTAVVKYAEAEAPACFAQLRCNTDLNTPPSNWLSPAFGRLAAPRSSSGFSSFRMAHRFPDCVGEVDQRSLVSKFLYHSLLQQQPPTNSSSSTGEREGGSGSGLEQPSGAPTPHAWAELPEAQSALPDKPHEFARNVVWTFEDIQMLIGTDMPIFGGSTHPCISLRLRYELIKTEDLPHLSGSKFSPKLIHDVAQNILSFLKSNATKAGHTYWLFKGKDDDAVKLYDLSSLYELIKTEDLPHLSGSKFSPKLIHDVAQNILSFLKSNATKAGHTYWLFKGKDDDAVKLYDLSSLVARNMKQQGSAQLGCIRTLLQNCLNLLDAAKHPQIATSAHFMLADLYVPADTDPAAPRLPEDQPEDEEEQEEVQDEAAETSVELQSLYLQPRYPIRSNSTPSALGGGVDERCHLALDHVALGLECLQRGDQDEPQMAQPGCPIPMPDRTECGSDVPVPKSSPQEDWIEQLQALLEQKATLALAVLAHEAFSAGRLGECLRHAKSALALLAARPSEQLSASDENTESVLALLGVQQVMAWSPGVLEGMQDALRAAVLAYASALEQPGPRTRADVVASLGRRLGNAHNELGVLLMGLASACLPDNESKFETLVQESQSNLESALTAFQNASDPLNLALVLANCGRLHRLRASLRVPLDSTEKTYYAKALDSYERAMHTLGGRHEHESLWDSLAWELSTTLFNLAISLQDCPPPSLDQERVEREASEALLRALHSCDVESAGARLPLYQFRAASLHHRLASLHHRALRHGTSKFALQLCRRHYERAAAGFRELEERAELLRVQLERVALAEFLAEGASGAGAKRRALHTALEEVLNCEPKELGEEEVELLKLLETGPDYKGMYAEALKCSSRGGDTSAEALSQRLSQLLPRLSATLAR